MQEDLISVVNKVQDTFNAVGGEAVDLPQIVTVGSQSSGKSSVLENIVGKDFLPRGSGIVTRRPLVLQLIHLHPPSSEEAQDANSDRQPTEYAEFLHTNQRFYDFADVRNEIENETKRVTGNNKGISKLPIHLKLYSERVLNLTLVDLPGLTKIPVGDQPSDIEKQIRGLVLDHITKPNCIILAISPANVDLANSESLKLARSVDPQGRRTIGVLTKLDLMDQGTNALDILTGRVYPLKLGFIGVVNRSQADIQEHKAMTDALAAEEEYFKTHPGYRNIAHRCGTRFLAKTLNQVLLSHIREKLPEMKARLNTLMGQTQQELAQFGDVGMGDQHRGTLVLRLMTNFARDFVSSIDGTSLEISTKELCGGARIYHIFHDVFGHALESINPILNLTQHDIRTAVRNSSGPRPSLFVPEIAFELLVKPQIKLLEPPSLRCVEMVYEELVRTCHGCSSTELQRFPRLQAQLIEVVSELLRERLGPTSEYVQSLISIQAAYINTNHPLFVNGTTTFAKEQAAKNQEQKKATLQRRKAESRQHEADDTIDEAGSEKAEDSAPANILFPDGKPGSSNSLSESSSRSGFKKHHSPGSSTQLAPPRPVSPVGLNPAMGAAPGKDSFLNYFFGGSQNGPALANGHMRSNRQPPLSGTSEPRGDNPLAGRRGLEGNAAAFDMKSLERHIEPENYHEDYNSVQSEREEMETALLQSLISAYFNIVRQTIQDVVPKAVMHLLVNFSRESVQNRLVASLYRENMFDELLYEDENLTSERNRIKGLLDAYKEAFRTLSDVL